MPLPLVFYPTLYDPTQAEHKTSPAARCGQVSISRLDPHASRHNFSYLTIRLSRKETQAIDGRHGRFKGNMMMCRAVSQACWHAQLGSQKHFYECKVAASLGSTPCRILPPRSTQAGVRRQGAG
jgi:hypothetical protein